MSYRAVRISGLHYDAAVRDLLIRNPDLGEQSYAEQQKRLFHASYLYSDGFSRAMRSLGHESYEIVCDVETLQKAWANEHGIEYSHKHWQRDIVLAQLRHWRPDVVYFQDVYVIPRSTRRRLKTLFPFIRLVVIYRGAPGGTRQELLDDLVGADVLLVGSPVLYDKCVSAGLHPHLVYHAFDEVVLDKIKADSSPDESRQHDFTFVGSSGFGLNRQFRSRYWALVELMQRTPLESWVLEFTDSRSFPRTIGGTRELLKALFGHLSPGTLEQISGLSFVPNAAKSVLAELLLERQITASGQDLQVPRSSLSPLREQGVVHFKPSTSLRTMFPCRCQGPLFGVDLYNVLRQSKVTLNKNSATFEGTVGNMRLFEATGVGACLLTDTGTNMPDLFDEDDELVTYASVDECVEKLSYLLENDQARRQIAEAGQARTLKDHTVVNRCQQVDDLIRAAF